jgi:hypothetical protein
LTRGRGVEIESAAQAYAAISEYLAGTIHPDTAPPPHPPEPAIPSV